MAEVLKHTLCKVSSTNKLNPSAYRYENMFSEDEFNSWMSDTKLPHMITLTYERPVEVSSVELLFQGGFAAKEMVILALSEDGTAFQEVSKQFFEDTNDKQVIQVHVDRTKKLRLVFPACYDLYNRMVIYSLRVLGRYLEE